jgi:hypothetical protein
MLSLKIDQEVSVSGEYFKTCTLLLVNNVDFSYLKIACLFLNTNSRVQVFSLILRFAWN